MDKKRKFRQRIQIVLSLFTLLIGITFSVLAHSPTANACEGNCFSVQCGVGTCYATSIFCSGNCSRNNECLQEVGFCTGSGSPCMCGVCTAPGYCD